MDRSSDLLFAGKIVAIQETEQGKIGWVEFLGVRVRVDLSLLPSIEEGDIVKVSGRTAFSRVQNDCEPGFKS